MPQVASPATNGEAAQKEDLSGPPAANRHRLPDERVGLTHHFSIAGHEGYLTSVFIQMRSRAKSSSGWLSLETDHCSGTVADHLNYRSHSMRSLILANVLGPESGDGTDR